MKGKIKYIPLIVAAFFMTRCANMVAPTGGAKDITPPKVTEATPENHSTGFNGRKIEVAFDEYVTLNNASQQVLVSPPLATKPDIKLSNKTVVIKLKEDLKPNTTYTIDFGEAVKDLHEGNLFKDYIYTFATGEVLDTLTLAGTILDAESGKPVEKLFVGLYRHCEPVIASPSLRARHCERSEAKRSKAKQSEATQPDLFDLPLTQSPDYLTRTDKDGHFHFYGLPDEPFLVFALEDMNANLFYDLPNERVAFLDTLVCPSDSVHLHLTAFVEIDTTQMLLENKLVEEGLFRLVFRQPADSVAVDLSWPAADTFQMAQVWSARRDTLSCWFTPNVLDSLHLSIHYDTLINIENAVNLKYRETTKPGRGASKELKAGDNLRNKLLMPSEELLLRFHEPIVDMQWHDTSMLIAGSDTLINTFLLEQADSLGFVFRLAETVNDTLDYTLTIADSVFHSIRGRANKAFTLRFKRAKESDFGAIYIKVSPPDNLPAIVQLLDSKGHVLAEQTADSTTRVGFTQLLPGKYKLQAVIDADRNGRWSPGNYHRRFLPETIVPYKDELEVKAGWDIDLDEIWTPK